MVNPGMQTQFYGLCGHAAFTVELLAKLGGTSAPDLPLPLAGFNNLPAYSVSRQSLLRSGAAYTSGDLQNCRFASGSIVQAAIVCAAKKIKRQFWHMQPVTINPCKHWRFMGLSENVGFIVCTQSVAFWCRSVIQGFLLN
jgi:hypothetical protein